ncbi:hypothetical protein HPB49_020254 [Dermacentor silvarum]|uniref:Uncharacterized protein n=1 Tax=Dermacentor silvarum TaxID=543639 RepID=A0ACB8CHB5_DERSI|nr:hypothetical protein HPB49_020254 [Dermacentor silvarum]
MLWNLAYPEKDRLLDYFNDIWQSGCLPEAWLMAVVVPVLKPRKFAKALTSYRPVSLTSVACSVFECGALVRLEWIARALDFSEHQTGFRRHRCTADSIADVVRSLEDARGSGEVALLVLLDVESALDGLRYPVIERSLDDLGVTGCVRRFVTAFLTGRGSRIRPEPFLFNLALASLPSAITADLRHRVYISVYADDVALWTRSPARSLPAVRSCLQRALDEVVSYFQAVGLSVSSTMTQALLVHPSVALRRRAVSMELGGSRIPWKQAVTYLGLLSLLKCSRSKRRMAVCSSEAEDHPST